MLNAYRQRRGARPCVVATTWTVPLALQRFSERAEGENGGIGQKPPELFQDG